MPRKSHETKEQFSDPTQPSDVEATTFCAQYEKRASHHPLFLSPNITILNHPLHCLIMVGQCVVIKREKWFGWFWKFCWLVQFGWFGKWRPQGLILPPPLFLHIVTHLSLSHNSNQNFNKFALFHIFV